MTLKRYKAISNYSNGGKEHHDVMLDPNGPFILHSDLPEIIRKAKVEAVNQFGSRVIASSGTGNHWVHIGLVAEMLHAFKEQLTAAPAGESEKS